MCAGPSKAHSASHDLARIPQRKSYRTAIARSTRCCGTSSPAQPRPLPVWVHALAHSVLKPGGVFIYLTFGQPHFRRRYLDRPGTTLEIRKLGDAFHYFLYIVRT